MHRVHYTVTKCFFVTGTDTNIGKTLAACALLQAAARAGYHAAGYKPVASGCKITSDGPRNCDALALLSCSNVPLKYHQVNPLAFIEPTAPHIASRKEKKYITIEKLSKGLYTLKATVNWLVVEGAGGWLTPIGEETSYADWVIFEKLPVILVVGIKLGCINHALLTALAIHQAKLRLVGWIANYPNLIAQRFSDYLIVEIQKRLKIPFLGNIPWLSEVENAPLADYIDISHLEKEIIE